VSAHIAKTFIEALRKLESERDVETIVSLFTDDAVIDNVTSLEGKHGTQGAREFWTAYRETFATMASTFRNEIISDNKIALEWETSGAANNGQPLSYKGVSILEVDNQKISRFYAYFDPRTLGRQIEEATHQEVAHA
jgi:hypothetical protein